ncbi:MAG: 4Fe-4S binding protein [Methanomicrobiales archaeon]|nr:4Fe-4S binding protein [Methanomicrobiales archaeon]
MKSPLAGGARIPASRRQRMRLWLIILSFILYPVTFAYISCPIITEAAGLGIVTGGFVVFALLFLGSLILGRLWCGWLCPSGGLQELLRFVADPRLRTTKMDWLKYLISLGIFGGIGYAIWSAGGLKTIDLFCRTENGISILAVGGVAALLGPVIIILIFTLVFGRRGFCHTFCPIGPMLIIGRKIRNLFHWPALQLVADAKNCIDCGACTRGCPMCLDVNGMVRQGQMEHTECIMCGNCAETCPNNAITYGIGSSR